MDVQYLPPAGPTHHPARVIARSGASARAADPPNLEQGRVPGAEAHPESVDHHDDGRRAERPRTDAPAAIRALFEVTTELAQLGLDVGLRDLAGGLGRSLDLHPGILAEARDSREWCGSTAVRSSWGPTIPLATK